MKKVYTFELIFDEEFKAQFALPGDCSLHTLAEACIEVVGFDFDHAFEFFSPHGNPYRAKIRYSLFADMDDADEDGGLSVNDTRIDEVFTPRKVMGFLFDYGDDWIFKVRCLGVKETDQKKPSLQIISKSGTPPEQYPDWEEED